MVEEHQTDKAATQKDDNIVQNTTPPKPTPYRPPHLRNRTNVDNDNVSEVKSVKDRWKQCESGPVEMSDPVKIFGEVKSQPTSIGGLHEIPVNVSGKDVVPPLQSFNDPSINSKVRLNIGRAHYTTLMPVQRHAIPIVMAERDLMACAQTGSGKTAAFLIPIISNMLNTHSAISRPGMYSRTVTPTVLILAPTRELATQIHKESLKFAYDTGIRTAVIYGGVNFDVQKARLASDPKIIIATPGRLLDSLSRNQIVLKRVKFLVLDEADKMLDMGFEPTIRAIVNEYDMPTKEQRNTLMFSATFPGPIQQLAQNFLNNYLFLTVGEVGSINENITQKIIYVEEHEKLSFLLDILNSTRDGSNNPSLDSERILIFVERKRGVDNLSEILWRNNFRTVSMHGDKSQRDREDSLRKFRNGRTKILVATAVASRGLDIPNVALVILYDFPSELKEYVHCIGRTGRAGNTGQSIAFFSPSNEQSSDGLISILNKASQEVPEWLLDISAKKSRYNNNTGSNYRNNRPQKPYRNGNSRYDGGRGRSHNTYGSRFNWDS